jgi:hypothetical protein
MRPTPCLLISLIYSRKHDSMQAWPKSNGSTSNFYNFEALFVSLLQPRGLWDTEPREQARSKESSCSGVSCCHFPYSRINCRAILFVISTIDCLCRGTGTSRAYWYGDSSTPHTSYSSICSVAISRSPSIVYLVLSSLYYCCGSFKSIVS